MKPKSHAWSSIDFSGRLPTLWVHPRSRKEGTPDGVPVTFKSKAELREMVLSLAVEAGLQLVPKVKRKVRKPCKTCHYECGGIVNGERFTCECRCHS